MAIIRSTKDEHILSFDEEKHKYVLDGKRVVGVTTFAKGGYPTSEALVSWMKGQTGNAVFDALTKKDSDGYKPKTNIIWPLKEEDRKEIIKAAKAKDKEESEKAAAIGTFVHDYAYHDEVDKVPISLLETIKAHSDSIKILAGVEKYRAWKKENEDEMVASEFIVASIRHSFGGKFDRLARRNGRYVLSDFKTSSSIYLDQFIQLAAYRMAIREWMGINVEGLEVLRFGKEDGEFQTLLIEKPEELFLFEEQAIRCRQTYEFRKLENDLRWKWGGKK